MSRVNDFMTTVIVSLVEMTSGLLVRFWGAEPEDWLVETWEQTGQ